MQVGGSTHPTEAPLDPACLLFLVKNFQQLFLMPKHNVSQLIGDLNYSNGKLEFVLEGFRWKYAFSKWGVFPPLVFPEEAEVHISLGSFNSFSKI